MKAEIYIPFSWLDKKVNKGNFRIALEIYLNIQEKGESWRQKFLDEQFKRSIFYSKGTSDRAREEFLLYFVLLSESSREILLNVLDDRI